MLYFCAECFSFFGSHLVTDGFGQTYLASQAIPVVLCTYHEGTQQAVLAVSLDDERIYIILLNTSLLLLLITGIVS